MSMKHNKNTRQMASLIHFSSLANFVAPPLGTVLPIVFWLIHKDNKFIDANGKVYLNALISYVIYGIVCTILVLVLIGIPLLIALVVLCLVETIRAGARAIDGENPKEYLLAIKFFN